MLVRRFEPLGFLSALEPGVREKAYAWKTAIGLQKVDGLTPSDYLIKTAQRNIEGKITLAESRDLIEGYYKSRPVTTKTEKGKKEADIVAQHITEILSESELVPSEREQVGEQVGGAGENGRNSPACQETVEVCSETSSCHEGRNDGSRDDVRAQAWWTAKLSGTLPYASHRQRLCRNDPAR